MVIKYLEYTIVSLFKSAHLVRACPECWILFFHSF